MDSSITVLVIDADEANRNFLGQLLQKKNYQVKHARSGAEGARMIIEAPPQIVIFDTVLPDVDATRLIKYFQQSPQMANVPCIVLSSRSDPEEMQACLQAGCAEYYVKSGTVMMALVDSIPRFLMEGKGLSKPRERGALFVFLSAKGGTGTSSLCANIGMNIAEQLNQSTVAVADLVLPMGSIAPLVGVSEYGFNLVTVAEQPPDRINPKYIQDNLVVPAHWLFHLLPGAPDPESSINLQVNHIPNIVESLRKAYDYVLVDLGRSLSKISLPVIHDADLVVLILSTDLSTVNHTKKLWHYLREQGIEPKRVFPILNRAVGLEGLTKAEAEKILEIEIKLMMPYMMGNFTLANNQNLPVSVKFPTDTASMVMKQAAIEMSKKVVKTQT
ncbi:MAG TPA: response regulator [Anaerolineales bacterium]|nr:response regulator [Anaerolineales bacterium]HLO33568.1 response regulator [Anaerolineales bacterium]